MEELGGTWRAVASTRTVRALPLAASALVWCGFTVFAIATALLGPGSGPRPGPTGPTIATLPFLSFHALFGGYLLWQAACGIVGDVRAVIDATTVRIGAGIRPLRRWRSRPLADVREVRTDRSPARGYRRTWL